MTCPECGSRRLRTLNQETICADCGLVIEDAPVQQNELLTSRASQPGLATAGTFQYKGRIVKHGWFFTTRQKNLQAANAELQLIAGRLQLPERITTEAMLLFKRALEADLTRGRDNQSFLYASVYAACLLHELPKTPLELALHAPISKVKMLRAHRILCRKLGIQTRPTKPLDLLQRFGSRLHLSQQAIGRAAELLEQAHLRPGRRPETALAAALYLAAKEAGEPRTQRQVANTVGVIEVTIRKQARELMWL